MANVIKEECRIQGARLFPLQLFVFAATFLHANLMKPRNTASSYYSGKMEDSAVAKQQYGMMDHWRCLLSCSIVASTAFLYGWETINFDTLQAMPGFLEVRYNFQVLALVQRGVITTPSRRSLGIETLQLLWGTTSRLSANSSSARSWFWETSSPVHFRAWYRTTWVEEHRSGSVVPFSTWRLFSRWWSILSAALTLRDFSSAWLKASSTRFSISICRSARASHLPT